MFSVISANFLYLLLPGFIGRIIIDNFSYSKKHNNFTFFENDAPECWNLFDKQQ